MMVTKIVLLVLEIIGTISFAVSGALVGVRARLDIFGVVFVGVITAFGGGIVRDLLIGRIPPAVFGNTYMIALALLSAIVVFIVSYINGYKFKELNDRIERINNVFDAIGLAAFSAIGTEIALSAGYSENLVFSVTLGVLTGIGGGIMRDIMTDTTPFVFKKHVYAVASLIGCLIYYWLRQGNNNIIVVSVLAMAIIFSIRMLATEYRWSLPKVDYK